MEVRAVHLQSGVVQQRGEVGVKVSQRQAPIAVTVRARKLILGNPPNLPFPSQRNPLRRRHLPQKVRNSGSYNPPPRRVRGLVHHTRGKESRRPAIGLVGIGANNQMEWYQHVSVQS